MGADGVGILINYRAASADQFNIIFKIIAVIGVYINFITAMQYWLDQRWRGAWESKVQRLTEAKGTQAVAWSTPWGANTLGLQKGLTKAENTIATLLRTGIIGLKD